MKAIDKIREIISVLNNFSHKDSFLNIKKAEEIVCYVLEIDRTKLYTQNPEITSEQNQFLSSILERLLKREPLQYILGECKFYNIKIKIGHGVLIPRPETEILVNETIKRKSLILKIGNKVLDLCTGSGCIALAVAKNIPETQTFGVDISEKAISYAKENKALNNIKNVNFIVGNLFEPFKEKVFACITANPPYVKTIEISELEPEVKNYEPWEALDGGTDGLNFYREIIKNAKEYLLNEGFIFLEIGASQVKKIKEIVSSGSFEIVKVVKDIAGIERVMILKNR